MSVDTTVAEQSARDFSEDENKAIPFWLSEHRVMVPGPVAGYFDRPELIERCMPTRQRLTLLWAPGGFGKTTVLAECCRNLAARGVPTAWLSLDDQDDPSCLEIYLAFAFQRAGLDLFEQVRQHGFGSQSSYQPTAVLLQTLHMQARPCVLVLDELERLKNPESVAQLNAFLRAGPPGLHLAVACRELPAGFDITSPVFEGDAELITADHLRFSRPEITRFFEGTLSRHELAAVAANSAGWPIALHIRRASKIRPVSEQSHAVQDLVLDWVESRLWYDLADDDREFLLDVGLLDWIDAELLDEVLEGDDLLSRLDSVPGVAGLFEPVRKGIRNVRRLHPLIREHCADRRRRENPERYRSIHRRIAEVLARRRETVAAMRHAAEAGDTGLVGRIFVDAGGVRIYVEEGIHQLVAADRLVSDETIAMYPRLAFARAVAQAVTGRLADGRRTLAAATRNLAAVGPEPDMALELERYTAVGMLIQNGCEPVGSSLFEAGVAQSIKFANMPGMNPLLYGAAEYGLCMTHNLKAEFGIALERGIRAQRLLGTRSPYMAMALNYQIGQIAMAQGRAQDAADWYGKGVSVAKRRFLEHPRLVVLGEVLIRELKLERNTLADDSKAAMIPSVLWANSAQLACFAAAVSVAAELVKRAQGADAAVAIIDEARDNACRIELPALERYLAGQRVALLVDAGRVGDAERRWRQDALPRSHAGCLDLTRQSWLEMESLSCARLSLLRARGEVEDGRRLARDLIAVATERGLRRTRMRALALTLVLEESAGNRKAALAHLAGFLELYVDSDYPRPLVRERSTAVPLLNEFIDASPNSPFRSAAQSLLAASKVEDGLAAP